MMADETSRLRLLKEIGAGGMATVYLAQLKGAGGLERTVAVKKMHAHLGRKPEFVEMFVDEAIIASRIRHPHVAGVLDTMTSNNELLLVMDFIEGVSLARLVELARDEELRMPIPVAVRIACDALSGLDAAHRAADEKGNPLHIVHRDISPHNLMVGADGSTRVLDFGIAHANQKIHQTLAGVVRGQAGYMAPEQLSGDRVDARADIYSMGLVLWEMLAGRTAYSGRSDAEVSVEVLKRSPEPLVRVAPEVSPELSETVARAISRDPAKRQQTAREFWEELEGAAQAAPTFMVADFVQDAAADVIAELGASSEAQEEIPIAGAAPRTRKQAAWLPYALGLGGVAVGLGLSALKPTVAQPVQEQRETRSSESSPHSEPPPTREAAAPPEKAAPTEEQPETKRDTPAAIASPATLKPRPAPRPRPSPPQPSPPQPSPPPAPDEKDDDGAGEPALPDSLFGQH